MTVASVPAQPERVLGELLPASAVREVGLVVGAVLVTAVAAQVVVPLPFTPVPISGQTFAVLLAGAALGPARAAIAMLLYWLVGAAGLPFYAGGESGLSVALGATGGYLLGFVLAAAAVGTLARRGYDRRILGTAVAYVVGSAIIYAVGVTWLMVSLGTSSVSEGLRLGMTPFLLGDLFKALLAVGLLPTAWRLLGRE